MITDAELEASTTLKVHEIRSVPVDVFALAKRELIMMCPTKAATDFYGRLEYSTDFKRFLLYYPDIAAAESNPRVRFSVGHELGHYFLNRHRESLLAGASSHNSVAGFICDKEMEHEADCFSSGLLVPETILKQRLQPRGFLALDQILRLAADCQTSRESAAIRYVRYAEEICAVVVSRQGSVIYSISSDDAQRVRFIVKRTSQVPGSSAALIAPTVPGIVEGEQPGSAWCSWSPIKVITEESIALGYGDLVLTILSHSAS